MREIFRRCGATLTGQCDLRQNLWSPRHLDRAATDTTADTKAAAKTCDTETLAEPPDSL